MLTNKTYIARCRDCDHEYECNDYPEDCLKCGSDDQKINSRYGKCVCGAEVEFSHFTNTCKKCNRDYNSSGQKLAPRSQWGQETGESLADILRIK